MLSKCANPVCPNRFLYLHEGKIFNVEVDVPSNPDDPPDVTAHGCRLEHYLLCGNCSRTLIVVYEHGEVMTRLAHLALAPASSSRGKAHAA